MISELAIVLVVATLFMAVAWPAVVPHLDLGSETVANAQVGTFKAAIAHYKKDMKSYPPNLETLATINPNTGTYWITPGEFPTADPWGTTRSGIDGTGGTSAYAYSYDTTGFAVWSYGRNKTNTSGGSGTVLPSSIGNGNVGVFGQ